LNIPSARVQQQITECIRRQFVPASAAACCHRNPKQEFIYNTNTTLAKSSVVVPFGSSEAGAGYCSHMQAQ
jgi:hypothetical protein